jgi:hypothetical protein
MNAQWKNFVFWGGAILLVVLVTVFYQPAAARTGSLLVWTNDRVYVMDIDSLTLERVAPAERDSVVAPSPGCTGWSAETPCWVLVDTRLYRVDLSAAGSMVTESSLPLEDGFGWTGGPVSWSPDGLHLAYTLRTQDSKQAQLRVLDAESGAVKLKADGVDAEVAVAWSSACLAGLRAENCEIGYKRLAGQQVQGGFLSTLIGFKPATGQVRQWAVTPDRLFELRWGPDDMLYYSRPARFFHRADDHSPAYQMPEGAQLADLSPDGRFTVYYQPFTLEGCEANDCTHLGVWLQDKNSDERSLIYNVNLSQQESGLNFIPIWRPDSQAMVFFQEGKLIYYDVAEGGATIWYKPFPGKLRSLPVFSPNEEAVAFVDSEGQGYSDFRLLVIDPRLQPVEHIIGNNEGFRVLAWLPN